MQHWVKYVSAKTFSKLNPSFNGPRLHKHATLGYFNHFAVKYFFLFGSTAHSFKGNFENNISRSVLNDSIIDNEVWLTIAVSSIPTAQKIKVKQII